MAERSSNVLKRLHPEEDDVDGQKRARSNDGSPRPTTPAATTAGARPDMTQAIAAAKARAAELKARLNKQGVAPTPASTSASSTPPASAANDRISQLKARIAAATSRSAALSQQRTASASTSTYTPPVFNDDSSRARGGLDIGLHPALLADAQSDTQRTRFTPGFGNRRVESPAPEKAHLDLSRPSLEELKENPYFDPSLGPGNVLAKGRQSRQLVFNQKGKYIAQAAALRRQAQLEETKKKIAERTRLAGLEEDLNAERAFLVPPPPDIEWWDEGLIDGKSYDVMDDPSKLKIDTPDSIITIYIQHPVLIEPPQEKNNPAPKPMYLTQKEQAKLRRQRRQADLKEIQAKIRLGLEPPPPPKVKKSNLMRVLGEEAVKDPTAVEARVNREIAERQHKHEEINQDRKLTKEQRAEKLAQQQAEDAARGIHVRVYKIDSLANGKHRFLIAKNAEQQALTGVVIMHPKLNLVVVEGGEHSIRFYDKLMQNRIKWQEMEAPRAVESGNREVLAKWLEAEDENGELKDLSMNKCELIFKGEAKQRSFKRWVGARPCETDTHAKDVLSRAKMENFWNLAKSFKPDF
ncbi:U4/U5/U6 small nuclear ribonucleoprotein prp3 [Exophiala xenobiotica]|uniref:U4/U5/U6 small nuclear ribonucleoprotein prp3 n=1 Tax=Vermiconidia calcicola TaxID=1690605 RepID=A0AAV9PZ63_9PEZI|nr:U4/U5/U6 small nuclear ribonucleoprotein prp3 [Exophiala xenobiotica]KAK5531929.1 U4/U5/U6 small nuclear ribonucleoprotein prp3 [Vermiconidia calcicola]KAK5537243.1 U4/U5/U6 small nuclear ribonucleoprotein prp3 [Chaetothyriales sp. CCFEE 6169]KAK5221244.1 U4/U5/U6 small nuclear ribonucleoprotein prp3 [Exophiala xenobiotica]KAK5229303.1 U4/U5/U6 small nuclear ribonucleoprotein prp3 [Exophiala xenobiotica]